MRDSCRRRLIRLGLGAAALAWPTLPAVAQPATLASVGSSLPVLLSSPKPPAIPDKGSPASLPPTQGEASALALEPAETTAPADPDTLPLQRDSDPSPGATDVFPDDASPDPEPANPGSAEAEPATQAEVMAPRSDLDVDYLTPHPNPLRLQTQPAEVEVLGTQPISLETAIELAYRNSEEMSLALQQLERAQLGLRGEQAGLYPTVDLSAGLQSSNQTTFSGGDQTLTTLTGRVRTDYDLDLSGERSARIQAAQEQVRLATLAMERTREELRLNTITDYYAVQDASEQIRINEAFLQEAEENLRITRLREEVGVGTRFDVLRAEVQVANARQSITQARSQREIAQRQLSRRLNIPPSITLTTLGVEVVGTWPLSLEESIVLAYQNRAELEQFLTERDFNAAQREAALAGRWPNLGVFAQYDLQDLVNSPTAVTRSTDSGFAVGAQLTWRLFDGGATQARAAQSEVDIRIDEIEFENARNTIRIQVEEAYYTLQANLTNIDTATLAVGQAQQALRLANLRFEAGVGTQTEVLSATSELTQAEGNLVRAKLEYNRALARLERAVSNISALSR